MVNVTLLVAKFRVRVRQLGFMKAVIQTARQAIQKESVNDSYDIEHGTDTYGNISLWKFRINSPNALHGFPYRTVSERRIESLLAPLPRTATFVDLGCGKGRPLLVAAKMQFNTVIGVEFVDELANVAESNLRKMGKAATVIRGDVTTFEFPNDPLVVYLYNPFDATVMASVARNLQHHKRDLWVIYINPRHSDLFDGWMKRVPLTTLQAELFTPGSLAIWSTKGCDNE